MSDSDDSEIEVLSPCKPKAIHDSPSVSLPSRANPAPPLPSSSKSSSGIPTRSSSRLKQTTNIQRLSSVPLPSTSSSPRRLGASSREPGPLRATRSARNNPQARSVSPSVFKTTVLPRIGSAAPIAGDAEVVSRSVTESPISTACRDSVESQVTSSVYAQQLPQRSLSSTGSSRRVPPHTSEGGPISISNEDQASGNPPQSPIPSRGSQRAHSRDESPIPTRDKKQLRASSCTKDLLPTKQSNDPSYQSKEAHPGPDEEGIERQADHKSPDSKRARYYSSMLDHRPSFQTLPDGMSSADPSSSQKVVEMGKANLGSGAVSMNQTQGTPQPSGSEHNSQPTSTKPTRRPQRPIKRAPKPQDTKPLGNTLEDEDAYFDLTARKPVQFISKTLGLTRDSPGPSSAAAKSPVRNTQAPSQPAKMIDLSGDEAESQADDDDDDDSEFSQGERRSRRKPRRSNTSPRKLPNWTKSKPSNMVAADSSSDSEKNPRRALILSSSSESETDKKAGKKRQADAHCSVPRPKSRSPTPPPPVDPYMIARDVHALQQNLAARDEAAALRNQLLAANQRAEEMRLMSALREGAQDPALVEIQRQLANSASRGNIGLGALGVDPPLVGSHGATITLGVRMVLDPRITSQYSHAQLDAVERTMFVQMDSGERFQNLYKGVEAVLGIPSTNLVLVHENIKLSPFVTPASLKIGSNTILKAYEVAAWNYVSTMRRQQPVLLDDEPEAVAQTTCLPTALSAPTQPAAEPSVAVEEPEGSVSTITITVRSGQKEDLELVVKPTTTFASIAKQFLKETASGPIQKAELSKMVKKCRVQFDGESLDQSSTVGETDIDKGDVLDLMVGS